MTNVEEFRAGARKLTEFEALLGAAPTTLDAIPGAVYLCDHERWLIRYNSEAAALGPYTQREWSQGTLLWVASAVFAQRNAATSRGLPDG